MSKHRMQILDWVKIFQGGKPFYTLSDLARLSGHAVPTAKVLVHRLAKKGLLIPVRRELYANSFQAPTLEERACAMYPPCYLSGETVLFQEGILDQAPFDLTLVTLNKSKRVKTVSGHWDFQHVKPELFFGYKRSGQAFYATPEKALCDYVYLKLQRGERLELDELNFEFLSKKKLHAMLKKYPATVRKKFETKA